MELNFWKYEGAGNDFILIDGRAGMKRDGKGPVEKFELAAETIRVLCDRHRGVGADGLMILYNEAGYDFRMEYHNSDGGEVNMCGNGGRCITLFAHHLGIGGPEKLFIGRDGEHKVRITSDNGETAIIEVGMIDVEGYEYSDKAFFLNTGVPHYVEFVADADDVDVVGRGREIRNSERFKAAGGTNVNFVEVLRHGHIKVRTYERGVEDETLACGTGAVASCIATHLYAQGDCNEFTVTVPGGTLDVAFDTSDNQRFTNVKLTGPARRIYRGTVERSNLFFK